MFILEHVEGVRKKKRKKFMFPRSLYFPEASSNKEVGFYVQKHIKLKGEFCHIYFDNFRILGLEHK